MERGHESHPDLPPHTGEYQGYDFYQAYTLGVTPKVHTTSSASAIETPSYLSPPEVLPQQTALPVLVALGLTDGSGPRIPADFSPFTAPFSRGSHDAEQLTAKKVTAAKKAAAARETRAVDNLSLDNYNAAIKRSHYWEPCLTLEVGEEWLMTYNGRCKASLCTPGTPCYEANKTQNTKTGVVHAPMLHFRTCTQGRMLGLAAIRKGNGRVRWAVH